MAESVSADATPLTVSEVGTPVAMDFFTKLEDGSAKKKMKIAL